MFSLLNGQGGVGLVWDDLDEEVGLCFLTYILLSCCFVIINLLQARLTLQKEGMCDWKKTLMLG